MTGQIYGLRFFYNEPLGWDETKLFIPARKKPSIHRGFSPDEVVRLIGAILDNDRLFRFLPG